VSAEFSRCIRSTSDPVTNAKVKGLSLKVKVMSYSHRAEGRDLNTDKYNYLPQPAWYSKPTLYIEYRMITLA